MSGDPTGTTRVFGWLPPPPRQAPTLRSLPPLPACAELGGTGVGVVINGEGAAEGSCHCDLSRGAAAAV